jgi:hypothetical protein
MMFRTGSIALAVGALLIAGAPAQAGSYVFQTITAPGTPVGDAAAALAINDKGQVVVTAFSGATYDYTDIDDLYNLHTHAYTAIPAYLGSVALSTQATGINNAGEIVGSYHPAGGEWQGFSFSGGVFSNVNAFGNVYNIPYGVSNNGEIVGTAGDFTAVQGYSYSGGVFTAIDAAAYPANTTIANGVNSSGAIVGISGPSASGDLANSFLDVGGVFTAIAMPGESVTFASGINDAGIIVGGASSDGFVTGPGFIDDHGVFTAINVPGATSTVLAGINNLDQIVGQYVDQNGNIEAFVATPAPEPTSWAMMILGLLGSGLVLRRRAPRRRGASCFSAGTPSRR